METSNLKDLKDLKLTANESKDQTYCKEKKHYY